MKEAQRLLLDTMDEYDRIKQTGISTARQGIAELSKMTAELTPRVDGLHLSRKSTELIDVEEKKSIEE